MELHISIFTFIFFLIVRIIQPSSCLTVLEAGPQNRTVFEGEWTSIICDFNNDNEKTIFWARVNSLGVQKFISFDTEVISSTNANSDDYDLLVDDDEQTYELVFKHVREAADDSWYECGYQYGQNIKYQSLARVYLTVLQEEYSFTCQYLHLPSAGAGAEPEVEVECVWNREVIVIDAKLGTNGVMLSSALGFSDRIISRMELNSTDDYVDITCTIVFDRNGFSVSATESCSNANAHGTDNYGIIRVDPFINEVLPGSDAEFICTKSEQSSLLSKFWRIVNMTQSALSEGQRIDNKTRITISDVEKGHEVLLVECRAILPGNNIGVSSFGAIRVSSPSTTLPPTSISVSDTYPTLTTHVTDLITSSPNGIGRSINIIAAVGIILLIIIIIIVVIIIFIVRRKKRAQLLRQKGQSDIIVSYGTNNPEGTPTIARNGTEQSFATPVQDTNVRYTTNTDSNSTSVVPQRLHVNGAPPTADSTMAAHVQSSPKHGKARGRPGDGQISIPRFRSLPLLDDNEFELVTRIDSNYVPDVFRTQSMTSLQSSPSSRRWTSQKMRRSTLRTPPKARHALSFRKPASHSDPNISSEYAQMSVKGKSVGGNSFNGGASQHTSPMYAQPDKTKNTNRRYQSGKIIHNSGAHNMTVALDKKYDDRGPSNRDIGNKSHKWVSTGSLHTKPMPKITKKDFKGVSLHAPSSDHAPPKPKRGKCKSEFLNNAAYSVVSDYEIMAKQSTHHYDSPKGSVVGRPERRHQDLSKGAEMGTTPVSEAAHQNNYELVDDEGFHGSVEVSEESRDTPQYAVINDVVYAFVDDI